MSVTCLLLVSTFSSSISAFFAFVLIKTRVKKKAVLVGQLINYFNYEEEEKKEREKRLFFL